MDFYTHGTLEKEDKDRSNICIILAHNCQIYQNHKSIELGIVVRRIVEAFNIHLPLLLLFTCCPARLLFTWALFGSKSQLEIWQTINQYTGR